MDEQRSASALVFDREQALASVDHDLALLAEIAELFLEDCPALLAEVQQAVTAGECEALARAAHTLKGSAGAVGAPTATELALDLETLGRERRLDDAPELVARLEAELGRLRPVLERVSREA